MDLSPEQADVVNLPLSPICVTACAGSGKTRTAVHRLVQMRRTLDDRHGLVALLSFSNIAVDTFRTDYSSLIRSQSAGCDSLAVEIDTVDGFITSNILRPHSHRTMGATRTAFLVQGREPFLRGFTVFDGKRPHPTAALRVGLKNGTFSYEAGETYAPIRIEPHDAEKAIKRLGQIGAYTHGLGRFWAIRTLQEQPIILRSLARRYPHILIDEAQDIGPEHQALLEMLAASGSQLSLIGDQNQGIYDFSGATGEFLGEYGTRSGVIAKHLTVNYRSVPAILAVANKMSRRSDTPDRSPPAHMSGAYFIPYKKSEKQKALSTFESMLQSAQINRKSAVIVCRSRNSVSDWRGGEEEQGQGAVKSFVAATVFRDKLRRYDEAFKLTCSGLVSLLADHHGDLASILLRSTIAPEFLPLKRAIWSFMRNADGLPSGSLLGKTEWHPLLLKRIKLLLASLEARFSLVIADNVGRKLANKDMLDEPIIQISDLAAGGTEDFHVSTVHQVKGESIDAVLYAADKAQVRELLDGTKTEVGRIGYVAVTRAKNLFVLAVPANCIEEFEHELIDLGFKKPGSA